MSKIKPIQFDIITIFPQIFDSYFNTSIVNRGQKLKKTQIKIHDLRQFAADKYKSVDDTPYGGGAGMVLKVEPILKCLKKIKRAKKSRVILFSAKGKTLKQSNFKRWLKNYDQLIMICGRYEGVDERVSKYLVDEEISIGNYVLTGGELPAAIVVDGITRLIPGVLGNIESFEDESYSDDLTREYPQYTKPESIVIKGKKRIVPKVLLSGHHKNIAEWREENKK